MRLRETPRATRKSRVAAARRAPSARLYSRVPRSSAWPSTVMRVIAVFVQPLRLLGQRRLRVGADRRGVGVEEDAVADVDREVLRGTRRSARRPAPRPRSEALFEVLLRGAAGDGEAHDKRHDGRVSGECCDAAHVPASPSNSSDYVEPSVTTLGLTAIQETGLIFGIKRRPRDRRCFNWRGH